VEEGKFVDGKRVGIWKEYYCNKSLKSKINYENNHPSGYAIMYHDNGKIKEEGLRMNDRWVGDYKLYFSNGQVQQAFTFVASGKREGPQQYFYENGRVMIDGTWVKGEKNGVLTEYYENGNIKSQKTFNAGHLDTASVIVYKPKTPLKETPTEIAAEEVPALPVLVQKNEKSDLGKTFTGEGYWKLYNANNQITKDGNFKKNRLVDGKIYFYNAAGALTRIAIYKEGKYIGDSLIEESPH
jgi:antitoxin component YwqK of YwqJK toxin-antitoxin module